MINKNIFLLLLGLGNAVVGMENKLTKLSDEYRKDLTTSTEKYFVGALMPSGGMCFINDWKSGDRRDPYDIDVFDLNTEKKLNSFTLSESDRYFNRIVKIHACNNSLWIKLERNCLLVDDMLVEKPKTKRVTLSSDEMKAKFGLR